MSSDETTPLSNQLPAGRVNTLASTLHRSGAVAQMLQMPVATLRVWERRYGVTQPELSPSGQRLYSAGDVRRLALVKRLSDEGHAIGRLASLDMAQLQDVAATQASARSVAQAGALSGEPSGAQTARQISAHVQANAAMAPVRAWRLGVIGVALGTRLQRPALLRRLGRPVQLIGPFADAAQAADALQVTPVDALLIHAPQLHEGWLAALHAAAPTLASVPKAVLFSFAAEAVCDELATAGTALMRDPRSDTVLAQWLQSLSQASRAASLEPSAASRFNAPVPPRRWDDAALVEFASLSSTIACECPRHVTELLMQLAQFEAYSAECANRSASDAALHAHLHNVAALSRARFEAALEFIAVQEGRQLPTARLPDVVGVI